MFSNLINFILMSPQKYPENSMWVNWKYEKKKHCWIYTYQQETMSLQRKKITP